MPTDEQIRNAVLNLVALIPQGKVSTYGTIARVLDIDSRQVGRILHSNTNPAKYPCHRVIHADGTCAAGYVFGGSGKQRSLLEKERVVFQGLRVVLSDHLLVNFFV